MKQEEIRAALDDANKEMLADALSIILTENKKPEQNVPGTSKPEFVNFSQAINYIKNNYDFPELDYFDTEADLVYVNAGDRRVLLTDKSNMIPAGLPEEKEEKSNSVSSNGRFSNLEI